MSDASAPGEVHAAATSMWRRLRRVTRLRTHAEGVKPVGVDGIGIGTVEVEVVGRRLTFLETGRWYPGLASEHGDPPTDAKGHPFRNVYVWELRRDGVIALAHQRFGEPRPVSLLELEPVTSTELCASGPHLCGNDVYDGALRSGGEEAMTLTWLVTGPNKDYRMRTTYTAR